MDGVQSKLSPKDAGAMGIQSFKEIMPEQSSQRVLLEGLEYDPDMDTWAVTVGFDTVRSAPEPTVMLGSKPSPVDQLRDWVIARKVESEVVREFRTFILNAKDGSLVKMKHG